ncbi:uncharacterized protein clmna [Xenentodon cancila]
MAGRGGEDWFEREEFIGQISDIRVQNLQVEREAVQKRTFTRWINLHLEKCDPPLQVQDLFQDIQDGHVLMALLEELSGCSLLHSFRKSSHRIFRLNNIATVLSFLEERNVKLVSIDAADVADGNASIILGLIWNIILFFQIKELTGNIRSQFPSSCSLSSIPTNAELDKSCSSAPSEDRRCTAATMRENSKAIRKLLQWIQRRTRKYGVAVQDFGRSWTSGLAFLALIKSIDSSLVDMRKALLRSPRENLEDAFRISHFSLGIPRLLEPEDVAINTPDEQSIIMYVSQFLEHFPGIEEEPSQPMERSVSMDLLNLRDGDSDPRNGNLHGRVRQRSYMFQRDQLPPKIWISSVSENRSITLPRLRPPAARSWSTEDFLSDSTHIEDLQSDEAGQQPDAQLLSSAPESAIRDSAINSPDSWADSELMPESQGDSFLWELYRATPVDVTPLDEGFLSSMEDRALDERSTPESYINEGMDSIQDRVHLGTDPTSDSTETDATKERDQMDVRQLQKDDMLRDHVPITSFEPKDLLTTDHLDQSITSITQTPPHKENNVGESPHQDQDGDGKDHNGQTNVQPENLQQRTHYEEPEHQEAGSPPEDERHSSKNEVETSEERNDGRVETHHELMRYFPPCEETSNSEAIKQEDASRSLNIPMISISSEPDKQDDNRESHPEQPDPDRDEISVSDLGQLGSDQDKDGVSDQEQPDPEQKGDAGQRKVSGCERTNTEVSSPHSRSGTIDLFYSDSGRGTPTEDLVADLVEPMDIFYPDKEESIFTEPPDTEMQRWPSVLSVSALQPAPVSDDNTEVHTLDQQGDDVTTVAGLMDDLDGVISLTNQEPGDTPASKEQCVMCGVAIRGTVGGVQGADGPADTRDVRESATSSESIRENWELWLLLLLWLLLYSLWLLPQMDMKILPDLLLNLDH